ncbi:MAG TPA: rRNA adenine dimethyltransferase family protein [Candidatus Paceibacterota bacterium]|jgi:16S rRNA (adenine1518-N6/adenine1519-N6)-dimethyltransferase|nr:rRNA adenine dimethyltransferase family protein [Candidatus Paceibacterota bacterium]
MTNKLLGQHFLDDPSGKIASGMIVALAPGRGETIVEIGPGHGELTRPLAMACGTHGARLIAIEKDPALAAAVAKKFSGEPEPAEIISGDALEILKSEEIISKSAGMGVKLIGNIPYYLTGYLLRIVGELPLRARPARCVFMVQKEVAERIIAEPPKMNRLAASVQFWAEPKILSAVSKDHFKPKPEVDSAIIVLEARGSLKSGVEAAHNLEPARYYEAVRTLFAQPRKTVLNNVAARAAQVAGGKGGTGTKQTDADKLLALHIDPRARPQNLTVGQIAAVAEAFF